MLAYFEDATGIDVEYGSSENYEQQAQIDAAAGSSANITFLPQPGLLADMASGRGGRMKWELTETESGFTLSGLWNAEPGAPRVTVTAVIGDLDGERLRHGTPLPQARLVRPLAVALFAAARRPDRLSDAARLAAALNS